MEENQTQNTVPPMIVKEPQSSPVPQSPVGSWRKVGILVVGVLLAGSITYAGYQYSQKQVKLTTPPASISTPTPDPTANWKSYNNQRYGYSIKYPPTFNVFENPPDKQPESLDFVIFTEAKLADILVPVFTIEVSQTSLEKAVAYEKWTIEGHVPVVLTSETSNNIDGKIGKTLVYKNDKGEIGPMIVVIQKDLYSYVLRTPSSSLLSFNQILSTFKFIDQNQIDETVGWKTFTSEDKTFSFKYPPQWIYETKKITLLLKYKGKERNVVSVSAGIPFTEEEWKMQQEYWGTSDAPKMGNNFSLLYATSPDFKNLNLDNPAEDLLSTAMVKENIDYQKDITLKNNIMAKEVGYGCQAYCIDIYFKNNNTIFDFSTGPNAETNIATLRQILSTFKFSVN